MTQGDSSVIGGSQSDPCCCCCWLLLAAAAAAAAAAARPHIYSRASQTGRNSPVPHTCTGAATDVYNPLSLSTPTQERTSYYSLCSQLTDSQLPGHLNRQREGAPGRALSCKGRHTHRGTLSHDSVCVTVLHAHVCVVAWCAWCAAPLTVRSAVQKEQPLPRTALSLR
jgi:hypothetical protein